jgi:hypothetical protein
VSLPPQARTCWRACESPGFRNFLGSAPTEEEPSLENTTMHAPHTSANQRLLAFNQQVLGQALALVQAHQTGQPRYEGPAGSHLRHIIEHYEALVFPGTAQVVDYDKRPRDRELEVNPTLAKSRLNTLQDALRGWHQRTLDEPVRVLGQGGSTGEFDFAVSSSIGRELVFVASHAVHHFALLLTYCQQHRMPVPAHFGKAPATVAYEQASATQALPLTTRTQESPCSATLQAA